jgi:hypothetical protein
MFCCTVRYSLSESTVFLVGEYGIPCRRVRYSLSESTVFLVGGYGIALRVPLRGIITAFAGLLLKLLSEAGQVGPKKGANLSAGTVFFVWEYGIFCLGVRYFLSGSTVFFVWEYGIRGHRAGRPFLSEGTVFFGDARLPLKAISLGKSSICTAVSGASIDQPHQGDDGWSPCRRVRYF